MQWLIDKLVGRVALAALGVMLGVCATLGTMYWVKDNAYDAEVTAHKATQDKLDASAAEVTRITATNVQWAATAKTLTDNLEHANRENLRIVEEGKAAVAAAERKRRAAQHELDAFKELFNSRSASCRGALEAMEAACPELSDY